MDSRTTSLVGRIARLCWAGDALPCSIASMSHRAASRPFSSWGCATVVSGGVAFDAAGLSSNPATENYASSLGVKIAEMTAINSSLYIKDLVVGTGAVAAATASGRRR